MTAPSIPSPAELPDLTDRLVVVTGASRGIGYFVARQAASAGAHVVAVGRTVGGLEELDDDIKRDGGGGATLVPLDLTDGPGVDRLGEAIADRWGRCDALIAGAATLGVPAPLGHVEAKSFEAVMALNVTATWRIARTLDPLLTRTPDSRALLLTCEAAGEAPSYLAPYAASKAAVEALARVWAAESAATSLRVNAVSPGATRTQLRAKLMPGEDRAGLPEPTEVARAIVALLDPAIDHNGRLYDARAGSWLAFGEPRSLEG